MKPYTLEWYGEVWECAISKLAYYTMVDIPEKINHYKNVCDFIEIRIKKYGE